MPQILIFDKNRDYPLESRERCKGLHCVDLGESFHMSISLQILASIPPRTSLVKFGCSPCTDPPGVAARDEPPEAAFHQARGHRQGEGADRPVLRARRAARPGDPQPRCADRRPARAR